MPDIAAVPVVIFDGTNFEEICDAMGLEEGDGIVSFDERPVLMKASTLDEMKTIWKPPWRPHRGVL